MLKEQFKKTGRFGSQIELVEMQNTVIEIKNSIERLNSKYSKLIIPAEESITDLEDRFKQITRM